MTDEDTPEATDADFAALTAQAHELGLHYTGVDPLELRGFIAMAVAERGVDHPVPCYGLSYDPSHRPCRVCQLRNPCADMDKSPRVEVADVRRLEPLPCEACRRGELSVELLDVETHEIRDYGCTTKGCQNTLGIQVGWESGGRPAEIVLGEPEEEKTDEDAIEVEEAVQAPALEVIEGGKSEPKPKKKVTVKKAAAQKAPEPKEPTAAPAKKKVTVKKKDPTKPAAVAKKAPAPKAKKVTVKKAPPKKKPAGDLHFIWDGRTYDSLTAIAEAITQSRNWSGPKFFKIRASELIHGVTLSRVWEGNNYVVRVEIRK